MTTFNVYRRYSTSESPVQIATGLTTKSYSDTTVTQGSAVLYSIGAVKNGTEKISNEIEVTTNINYFDSVDLLIFADAASLPSSNIVDSSSHARSITNSGATIQNVTGISPKYDDAILLVEATDSFSTVIQPLLTNDFTIETHIAIPSSNSYYPRMMIIGNQWGVTDETNQLNFQFSPEGYLEVYGYTPDGSWVGAGSSPISFIGTTLKHACFMRKDGIFYMHVEGVKREVNANHLNYSITKTTLNVNPQAGYPQMDKYINSLRITNGVARYNVDGFTPPSAKFGLD